MAYVKTHLIHSGNFLKIRRQKKLNSFLEPLFTSQSLIWGEISFKNASIWSKGISSSKLGSVLIDSSTTKHSFSDYIPKIDDFMRVRGKAYHSLLVNDSVA